MTREITTMKRILIFVLVLLALPVETLNYYETEKEFISELILVETIRRVNFEKDAYCLAKNIFYEAGGEPYEGRLAVATVTMNRVDHTQFPNNVCDVVYERNTRFCQFSWTCGPKAKFNPDAFDKALVLAEQVLTENIRITELDNALFFHNTSIDPEWKFAVPIKQIGNHIFYESRRNNNTTS